MIRQWQFQWHVSLIFQCSKNKQMPLWISTSSLLN
jgi:hypothetical protein